MPTVPVVSRPLKTFALWQAVLGFVAIFAGAVMSKAEILTGRLLENVSCEAEPGQRYALYVPSRYTPEMKWPVVLCFDPSARGTIPVEKLRAAAEEHGFIVAGSLNSRNGPFRDNLMAARAMLRDVGVHLSVDVQRIYALGMSGGARVAATLALGGAAKGAVVCGAGFPESGVPTKTSFPVFGIVGLDDYNLRELRQLEKELEAGGAAHRVVTFDGPHIWPPEPVLGEALAWLRLQAMRAGQEAKDEAFVMAEFSRRQRAIAADGAILETWRGWKGLAADFEGLADVTEAKARSAELGKSSALKKALKDEADLFFRETLMMEQLGDAAAGGLATKRRVAKRFHKQMEQSRSRDERASVMRAVLGYCAATQATARELIANREYPHAIALLEMIAELQPGQARHRVELARALCLDGDRTAALSALESAIAAGFRDAAWLEREPAFEALRQSEAFHALIEKAREPFSP